MFTLLQKFNAATKLKECFNASANIIVRVDEGHRSRGGENHQRMRKVLPNAAFVAFTSTPLLKDAKTPNKFGPILHAYAMCRAVQDFNMRWVASMVVEIFRILVRGGVFMFPRDTKDLSKPDRLRRMYKANPIAMVIEQAGGAALTGRERLMDLQPVALHQRLPVIVGSKAEVERPPAYHADYDAGNLAGVDSPLMDEWFHADA